MKLDNRSSPGPWAPWLVVVALVFAVGDAMAWNWLSESSLQVSVEAEVATTEVLVAPPIDGTAVRLTKSSLEPVTRGEVLVNLDGKAAQRALDQAQGDLSQAEGYLRGAQDGLERRNADLEKAKEGRNRNLVTAKDWDLKVEAHAEAASQVSLGQLLVAFARDRVSSAAGRLAAAVVEAPCAGLVAKRWVDTGDPVRAGFPVYTLFDPDNLWVNGQFGRKQLQRIHVGDAAEVTFVEDPGRTYQGTVNALGDGVTEVAPFLPEGTVRGQFTSRVRRGEVMVRLDPKSVKALSKPLRPGMVAEVRIRTSK